MTPTSILLFAAGLGTRMAPLTNTRPKPLVEVAGKPLIDHALDHCGDLSIVVNVHYFADQMERHLSNRDATISDETDKLRETGGGLKHALPLMENEPVFTMNTDAVWRGANPISILSDAWTDEMESLLLMIPRVNAIGHTGEGDFDMDANGHLTRGTDYVYSGVQIIRTNRLAQIYEDAFSMWTLWNGMLDRKTMFGVPYTGKWCDVGRPDSIPVAEAMLAEGSDV